MKIIVTIFPTDLITNSLLTFTNQKQESSFQEVVSLVTRDIYVFVYNELYSTSKPCRIQQTFIKEFSCMLFLFIL